MNKNKYMIYLLPGVVVALTTIVAFVGIVNIYNQPFDYRLIMTLLVANSCCVALYWRPQEESKARSSIQWYPEPFSQEKGTSKIATYWIVFADGKFHLYCTDCPYYKKSQVLLAKSADPDSLKQFAQHTDWGLSGEI